MKLLLSHLLWFLLCTHTIARAFPQDDGEGGDDSSSVSGDDSSTPDTSTSGDETLPITSPDTSSPVGTNDDTVSNSNTSPVSDSGSSIDTQPAASTPDTEGETAGSPAEDGSAPSAAANDPNPDVSQDNTGGAIPTDISAATTIDPGAAAASATEDDIGSALPTENAAVSTDDSNLAAASATQDISEAALPTNVAAASSGDLGLSAASATLSSPGDIASSPTDSPIATSASSPKAGQAQDKGGKNPTNTGCNLDTAFAPKRRAGTRVASLSEFIAYVRQVQAFAVKYASTHPGRSANVLVTEWLRHIAYNDCEWTALVSPIDDNFINTVYQSGIQMVDLYTEPEFQQEMHAAHLGACMNGVLLYRPLAAPDINHGDVTGWGGDLITFYGDWQNAILGGKTGGPYRRRSLSPSGSEYARNYLANDQDTTFKLRDIVEDADCFNMATQLLNDPSASIADVMQTNYLGGGYRTRMQRFFSGKFGTAQGAQASAIQILTRGDVIIQLGRAYLIQRKNNGRATVPDGLNPADLADFAKGFSNRMVALVNQERGGS